MDGHYKGGGNAVVSTRQLMAAVDADHIDPILKKHGYTPEQFLNALRVKRSENNFAVQQAKWEAKQKRAKAQTEKQAKTQPTIQPILKEDTAQYTTKARTVISG